jgi:tetratricopeptide (TPR) repeat protein
MTKRLRYAVPSGRVVAGLAGILVWSASMGLHGQIGPWLDTTTPRAPVELGSPARTEANANVEPGGIEAGSVDLVAREPEPRDAGAFVARGNARLAETKYDDAIADYTAALQLDAAHAPAHAARAHAWARKHDREREVADYGQAIRTDPTNTEYRVARADSYSAQGMHDQALADYDEALRLEPSNPAIWVARGKEWQRDYKVDQAIADFTRAIQLDPRHTPAYIARGNAWKLSGAFEQAIQEFDRLARVDAENAVAHRTLARILATCIKARIRDGRRALEEATRACELTKWQDPDSLDTLAAACAETGDFPSAIKWQTQAIALVRQHAPTTLRGPMDLRFRSISFEDRLAFYKSKKPTRE